MTYDRILIALADPTRRDILERLRAGPMAVGQIAKICPVSRPAVSQHLKVLELSGLVEAEAKGASRHYRVRPGSLAPLRSYLDNVWGDVLDAFSQEVHKQMEEEHACSRNQDD